MKKIKKALLLVTLLVLFVGVVSASDAQDNTPDTHEVTQKAVQETKSITYDTGSTNTLNTKDTVKDTCIVTDEIRENRTDKKLVKEERKNVKTAGETYNVNDFSSLRQALLSDDYDDVTINVESNIILQNSTKLETSSIKTLTINGNEYKIDGNGKYQFLTIIQNCTVTINNLTFTNCFSEANGGVIDTYGGNITFNNCKFNDNKALFGGALNTNDNTTVILNNCILTGNTATGKDYEKGGGAIFHRGDTLRLNNCTLTRNYAASPGGALFTRGTAVIKDSTINNNRLIMNGRGGAIFNWVYNLTIINSTLNNNSASEGGVIYNSWANLTITDSTLEYNTADSAGAVYNYNGFLTITNSTLNNNYVENKNGVGGGALLDNYGVTIINNTILNNNIAESVGGAIHNFASNITVYNSVLNNNTAKASGNFGDGGAVFLRKGTISIYNCLFNDNNATNGGALYNNGTMNISNSTFNENSAKNGGAIYAAQGKLNLKDSTFKDNVATEKSNGGAIYNLDEAEIYANKFITNQANDDGEAIKHTGIVTIAHNINDGRSIYGATINTKGDDVDITYNEFYVGIFNTNLIISLNSSSPRINDKINVTVRLTDQFNIALPEENIRIYINNKSHSLIRTAANGTASFEYNLTNKSVNITAKYNGDRTHYYPSTATLDITIPSDTQLVVEDVSAVAGRECRINGTLQDITGTRLIQETVYITVDNHTYLVNTNDKGQFETTTVILKSGKYDMLAIFNGSSDYYPSNKTQTVTVLSQADIDIEILNNTQSNVKIEITVTDETGAVIPEQEVIITLPNATTTTQKTTSDGKITVTDSSATVGEKTVTATVESTDELNGTTETKNINIVPDYQKIIEELIKSMQEQNKTINELNATVKVQKETIDDLNSTVKVQKEAIDDLNTTVNKQNNTISNQNKAIKDLTNRNRVLNDTVNNLTGELMDANDKISEQNAIINDLNTTVKKQNKTIKDLKNKLDKANKEIQTLNDTNKDLTEKLEQAKSENKKLNNKINKLNKQINTLNKTVNNLTSQLNDANNIINSLNKTNKKLKTQLQNANKEIKTLKNTINYLSEQLNDADKIINSLNKTNKKLKTQLNKANKEIKTLNNTVNKVTKELNDANMEIKILNDEINRLLNKTKLNTTITINPVKSSVGSVTKLTANVIDQNGDKVTDGRVIFKINGKTLKDEYNNTIYAIVSEGTASLYYKVQNVWMKNTTSIEAVYSGSEKYNSSRVKSYGALKIREGIASITLEKATVKAKVGETITLRAKILDSNGDRINGSRVVFKLNGKSLCDKNGNVLYAPVVDGEAVLDYTLPSTYTAKTHNITAVFDDGYHERAETYGKLVLRKKGVTINTDSITTKNGRTNVKATIRDETGALLVTGTKLAVKVNGSTVVSNVNSTNGKIDVSFVTSLRPGMYELVIISGENGLYTKGTMTTVLII